MGVKLWGVGVQALSVGWVQHDDGLAFARKFGNLFGSVAEEVLFFWVDATFGQGRGFHVVLGNINGFIGDVAGEDCYGRNDVLLLNYVIPRGFLETRLVLEGKVAAFSGNESACHVGGFQAEGSAAGHRVDKRDWTLRLLKSF